MITTRTALNLTGLTLLAGAVAFSTLGPAAAVLAILLSLVTSTAAYWGRRRATLRVLGGRPLQWYEYPELHELTELIARKAGLPKPRLYLMPGAEANAVALATATESAVGVTEALLRHLSPAEAAAVVAHEVAHIRHKDLLLAMAAGGLAGSAALLAEFGRWGIIFGWLFGLPVGALNLLLAVVVAGGVPVMALALRMAISREREFLADAGAAGLVGSPELLAQALWRLEQANQGLRRWLLGWGVQVQEGWLTRLLSSHPPMKERIRRLMAMRPPRRTWSSRRSGWVPVWESW